MAVGLSPMKPLHAAPMRLDFFVAGGNPYAARPQEREKRRREVEQQLFDVFRKYAGQRG